MTGSSLSVGLFDEQFSVCGFFERVRFVFKSFVFSLYRYGHFSLLARRTGGVFWGLSLPRCTNVPIVAVMISLYRH
jgi:hypothetical protein